MRGSMRGAGAPSKRSWTVEVTGWRVGSGMAVPGRDGGPG